MQQATRRISLAVAALPMCGCIFDLREPPRGVPAGTIELVSDERIGDLSGVTLLDGEVFVGDQGEGIYDGRLYRIDAAERALVSDGMVGINGLANNGNKIFQVNGYDSQVWERLPDGGGSVQLAGNDTATECIAADAETQLLLVTRAQDGEIRMVGPEPQQVAALVSGEAEPAGVAVAAARIYWINSVDGDLRSSELDGSDVRTEWDGSEMGAGCMAAHGDELFWVNTSSGKILRFVPGAAEPEQVADALGSPRYIDVDADWIYFTITSEVRRIKR